jgi:hypothetical protein
MKHVLLVALIFTASISLKSQNGTVADFRKISDTEGNLDASLESGGKFGYVQEAKTDQIISSAPFLGNGVVYFIGLAADGSAETTREVRADNFSYFADKPNSEFGTSVVPVPDQNSDNAPDYVVGTPGLFGTGGLVMLLSNPATGQFGLQEVELPEGIAAPGARIGEFLALDGNDLLITSLEDAGKIFRCNMEDGELSLAETIDISNEFLASKLENGDRFGSGLSVYDINGDGADDILCGAPGDDDQDTDFGAAYLLYRDASKNITGIQKLSRLEGDFGGFMNTGDEFGISVRGIGDIDENGADDLAIGAPGDDDGGLNIGAVWILFMRPDGTVRDERKINRLEGNFDGDINFEDAFGSRIATIGDHNGDGTIDMVVGSINDDDGGNNKGALFTIFIERCPSPSGIFSWEVDGGTVQFFSEGGPGYSHIWNFDDGGYSQQQNPVHTYQSNGTYWVCLAINNDCGGNNYCQNVSIQTLSTEEQIEEQIKIFPNPATSILNVRAPLNTEMISVMDITGKIVEQISNPGSQHVLDLSNYSQGIYLLELQGDGFRVVKKVSIQK